MAVGLYIDWLLRIEEQRSGTLILQIATGMWMRGIEFQVSEVGHGK